MMVLHDVNGFQITSFNPSGYLCDWTTPIKRLDRSGPYSHSLSTTSSLRRVRRPSGPRRLAATNFLTSTRWCLLGVICRHRRDVALGQKLTSDSRQAESALNGPSW